MYKIYTTTITDRTQNFLSLFDLEGEASNMIEYSIFSLPRFDFFSTSQSPLYMIPSSDTYFSFQMTTIALKNTHIHMHFETHQEQKVKLQFVQLISLQSPNSSKIRVPIISVHKTKFRPHN